MTTIKDGEYLADLIFRYQGDSLFEKIKEVFQEVPITLEYNENNDAYKLSYITKWDEAIELEFTTRDALNRHLKMYGCHMFIPKEQIDSYLSNLQYLGEKFFYSNPLDKEFESARIRKDKLLAFLGKK